MKKLSGISVLVSTVVLAGLCGCASSSSQSSPPPAQTAQAAPPPPPPPPPPKPKKDKRPIEQRLVVGMSMDDVRAACGNPKNVAMNSDGSGMWEYDNSQNAFIPFYMASGNTIHHVTIIFDTGGKVKSWSVADVGRY